MTKEKEIYESIKHNDENVMISCTSIKTTRPIKNRNEMVMNDEMGERTIALPDAMFAHMPDTHEVVGDTFIIKILNHKTNFEAEIIVNSDAACHLLSVLQRMNSVATNSMRRPY